MGMTNSIVVYQWYHNKYGRGNNMYTDGKDLYSYALKIGITISGRKVLFNYTGHKINGVRGKFRSQTTSHHVSLASRHVYETYIVAPDSEETDIRKEILIQKLNE